MFSCADAMLKFVNNKLAAIHLPYKIEGNPYFAPILIFENNEMNDLGSMSTTPLTIDKKMEKIDSIPAGPLTSFHLFPLLPAELREHIFVPRRVILKRANSRPQTPRELQNIQLVKWESKLFFHSQYKRCFHNLGQKPLFFNHKLDTLALLSGLKALGKLARQYPDAMSRMHRIQLHSDMRENWGARNKVRTMDISCLSSSCTITVRSNPGRNEHLDNAESGAEIICNLLMLKHALLLCHEPTNTSISTYQEPRLMALFTTGYKTPCVSVEHCTQISYPYRHCGDGSRCRISSDSNDFALQTTHDLHHVRFERNKLPAPLANCSGIRRPQEDRTYTWNGKDVWGPERTRDGAADDWYSDYLRRTSPEDLSSRMYKENKFVFSCYN